MIKRHLLLLLLVLTGSLRAQVLTSTQVLQSAATDLRIGQNQSLQQLAGSLNMTDPLLRQITARVGINGSALGDTIYGYVRNEDTYSLQIGFNSFWERRRQRQLQRALAGAYTAEQRLVAQQALAERYQALAAYLYTTPELSACRKLDSLLAKEHDILREMLNTGILEVKVSKVLDAEELRNRNQQTMQALESTLLFQKNRLRQFAGDFAEIDQTQLAGAADFKNTVALLKSQPLSHPAAEAKNADIQVESANLAYVNAQNRQVLSNFNAGYQRPLYLERPKRFNTFNNVYFRVGLSVPLPANNRFKKANALLDLREAQNDAAWSQVQVQRNAENQFVKLENLFREYQSVQDRIDNSLIRRMLDNAQLLAQITPLERIELEIAQQKLLINRAALLADTAVELVRLLEYSGAMSNGARINYLSATKEAF